MTKTRKNENVKERREKRRRGRRRGRKRRRETEGRERVALTHSPEACSSQGWVRLEPGTQNSILT